MIGRSARAQHSSSIAQDNAISVFLVSRCGWRRGCRLRSAANTDGAPGVSASRSGEYDLGDRHLEAQACVSAPDHLADELDVLLAVATVAAVAARSAWEVVPGLPHPQSRGLETGASGDLADREMGSRRVRCGRRLRWERVRAHDGSIT